MPSLFLQLKPAPGLRGFGLGVLLLGCFSRSEARAAISVMGGIGGVAGYLQKTEARATLKGYCYSFNPSWYPEFAGLSWLNVGLLLRQMKFGYTEQGAYKRATYNLTGVNTGVSARLGQSFRVHLLVDYYQSAELSSLATHTDLLNGRTFKYSSLQVYDGGPATGGRLTITHDKSDGQFSKSNQYRSGLGLAVAQQKLNKESTKIEVSNSVLSPGDLYDQVEVDYAVIVVTLEFFVGLTF